MTPLAAQRVTSRSFRARSTAAPDGSENGEGRGKYSVVSGTLRHDHTAGCDER